MKNGNLSRIPKANLDHNASIMKCKDLYFVSDNRFEIQGDLQMMDHSQSVLGFKVVFEIVDRNKVAWSVEVPKVLQRNFNYIELTF